MYDDPRKDMIAAQIRDQIERKPDRATDFIMDALQAARDRNSRGIWPIYVNQWSAEKVQLAENLARFLRGV